MTKTCAYKQQHYATHRRRYIEAAQRRKRAVVAERTAELIAFFRSHPCTDCGETDPLVLEFDHRGNKAFNISKGLRDRSWPALVNEIAKCDVVCANCHRRRTAHRGGFARAVIGSRPPRADDATIVDVKTPSARYARNS